jgi:hypothetical protein
LEKFTLTFLLLLIAIFSVNGSAGGSPALPVPNIEENGFDNIGDGAALDELAIHKLSVKHS